jgi:hypothetical protein
MGLFTTDDLVTSWTSSRHGGSIALALALSRECIGDLAPGKPHDGQEFFGKTLPIFAKFTLSSGKLLHSYGQLQSLMGKSTINGHFQ